MVIQEGHCVLDLTVIAKYCIQDGAIRNYSTGGPFLLSESAYSLKNKVINGQTMIDFC